MVGVTKACTSAKIGLDPSITQATQVPLAFFRDDPREITHRIDYLGHSWYVPSYRFGEFKIWGLTAVMIVELVNVAFGAGIDLAQPPQPSVRVIKV